MTSSANLTTDILTDQAPLPPTTVSPPLRGSHPALSLLGRRSLSGLISVLVVAVIVYFATLVLPGDAATAILGNQATPARVAQLRHQLGLDRSALAGFWSWFTGLLHGDFGRSLSQQRPVSAVIGPRLANSAVLIVLASIASTAIGIALGALAAARRDKPSDHGMSVVALVASALPEFIVGVFVVLILAIKLPLGLPALSILRPGEGILVEPLKLLLPLVTLTIVTTPYVFRMTRAATIDALTSDYAEVARLKGVSQRRLIFRHALPNAMAPIIQVVGLNLLYLAGGIVLVETVFQYPGIGLSLVDAVTNRDVPVIQFLVVILSVFYVLLNIVTDLVVLLVTPRKRYPR